MTELFTDAYAQSRDAADPLRAFRDEFFIPQHGGKPQAYFVGNSLGLQPKGARAHVEEVLDKWATEAVEGHFTGSAQWMPYHELVRDPLARVVGAQPSEVVAMNSLTANLHLMMVGFYRPAAGRDAILIEAGAFPSDRYAVESQLRFHGVDPAAGLIEVQPDAADGTVSMAAIERAIAQRLFALSDQLTGFCSILGAGHTSRSRRVLPGCSACSLSGRIGQLDDNNIGLRRRCDLEMHVLGEEQRQDRPSSTTAIVLDRPQARCLIGHPQGFPAVEVRQRIQ